MILPVLLAMIARWLQRHQPHVITYRIEENRVLQAQLGGRRLRLTDTEGRRLVALAHPLGRQRLQEGATMATPETLLRWYKQLMAQKFDGSTRRTQLGRPPVAEATERLAVQRAEDNPSWDYRRMPGALAHLGHQIDTITVRNILRRHHMEPAPHRRKADMSWAQFLKLPWEVLAATDFCTVEVVTWHGLVTYDVRVVMELATRRVEIAGIPPRPACSPGRGSSQSPVRDALWASATCSTTETPRSRRPSMGCGRTVAWSRSSCRPGVPSCTRPVNASCAPSRRQRWSRESCWVHAPCIIRSTST